jgi:CheY-like chemotaxis protein
MAYGFVKQSGGHIQIDSAVGQGTTVRIYLPRSSEPEAVAAVSPGDVLTGGNETILVVEDDPSVQATVVAILTELGYRVIKANDGESALNIIKSGVAIDLLFTDVVMPGRLRGPDLAKEARQIVPGLAVLFTSGYTQNAMGQSGRLGPDVNLLSKPYRREQLALKVRQLLPNKYQAS